MIRDDTIVAGIVDIVIYDVSCVNTRDARVSIKRKGNLFTIRQRLVNRVVFMEESAFAADKNPARGSP
jgi:hypothetical protein